MIDAMHKLTRPVTRALLLGAVAAALTAACSTNSASPTCTLCSSTAVVRGTVRDTAGAPKAGASVTLQVFAYSCTGSPVGFVVSGVYPQTTDSTGQYRYPVLTSNPAFPACIETRAVLASDTTYRADTLVTGKLVQFRNTYPAGAALDSLTVDVVLRHQ